MKNVISVNFKIVCLGFFYSICFTIFQKYTYRVETCLYLTMSVHWLLIQILDPRCNMHIFYEC